jgi:hypothetical protein
MNAEPSGELFVSPESAGATLLTWTTASAVLVAPSASVTRSRIGTSAGPSSFARKVGLAPR